MSAPDTIPFKTDGPHPLVAETRAGEPYPVAALGPLREAVEAVQGAVQAPVAIPAQSALCVASLAVQGFADVETLGGPRPVSLYALTVALSGERKSSCDAPFMAALRDHEREQADGVTLAQFYLSEAQRIADAATVSAETNRAERLRKWLVETWPHADVTLREVQQMAPVRALRENAKARAALGMLEQAGWVVRLERGAVIRGAARNDAWRIVTGGGDVV